MVLVAWSSYQNLPACSCARSGPGMLLAFMQRLIIWYYNVQRWSVATLCHWLDQICTLTETIGAKWAFSSAFWL